MRSFRQTLESHGVQQLTSQSVDILQVNIGRKCNQACHHCHVEASPLRTENMDEKTIDRVLELLSLSPSIHTVDITGGAPEMNPHFRKLVHSVYKMGKKIIDRCNLTVLFEPGQEETAYFLKEYQVRVVASLPCYIKGNVEKQRGQNVFDKSILALQLLNRLGYGKINSNLELDLVYNPAGPRLPPLQSQLELDYKKELRELFGIEFNHLFTMTNMPIKRFLSDLNRSNQYESYMKLLEQNFNVHALDGVMCRNLVSVSWNGELFDCDFNQMLNISLSSSVKTLWDINSFNETSTRAIALADHCYACTAGAGSSCAGALI